MPGLLVTGRTGSGKTSVLRAVAKSLQENPETLACTSTSDATNGLDANGRIDIFYVDVAKYVDSPVSKVKALLKYWYDKAAWHRPSVIVLDNLDKLMGVELEVSLKSHLRDRIAYVLGSMQTRSVLGTLPSSSSISTDRLPGSPLLTREASCSLHLRIQTRQYILR